MNAVHPSAGRAPAGASGYVHPLYAASLARYGRARELRRSGGWLLERPIPAEAFAPESGPPGWDAMGCYPLFACLDWGLLEGDLVELEGELVSLVLVSDPFGDYRERDLRVWFPDLAQPYKLHFVADLSKPAQQYVSRHHRDCARSARKKVQVSICAEPASFLDDWCTLYSHLIEKRGLRGIHTFSRETFAALFEVPGVVVLRADCGGEPVGAHVWLLHDRVAYSHLASSSEAGYRCMAAYALHDLAFEIFAQQARWLDLGAGAGAYNTGRDGLTWFKQGWSSGARPAYLCGRILDRKRYAALEARFMAARGLSQANYFPVYRYGEFY